MSELLKRFEGTANKARLKDAVARQALVAGDAELAQALVDHGALKELAAGDRLIEQGKFDDDLFLILAGSFDVVISGRYQAVRSAGVHVGEQSGIDSSRPRSASLIAREPSLVLRLTQAGVQLAAGNNTDFWKRLAITLQERLEERNSKIGQANISPRVFVISSSEAMPVAEQVHLMLDGKDDIAVQIWDQGTFGISEFPISSLMDTIESVDFTISIVRGDDTLISRGKRSKVARDNVHLEYGISLGTLGRKRSIVLVCADDKVKLPSDLSGLTTVRYRHKDDDDMKRSIRSACIEIREHIGREGVFQERRC